MKTCCYCCDVRTGTKIIGIVRLIISVCNISSLCIAQGLIDGYTMSPEDNEMLAVLEAHGFGWILISSIIITLIELIFTIMMVIGTFTNRGRILLPWMIGESLVTFLLLILMCGVGLFYAQALQFDVAVVCFVGAILFTVPRVYFILVVRSHYRNLLETNFGNCSIEDSQETLLNGDKHHAE